MAVGRGPTSLREYRRTRSSTRCGRIRCGAGCSTRGPSGAFTYRSTRAITGSRSSSTCRRARCATSSCTTATSSWRRTAARSGSWTTSRRCAKSRPPPRRRPPTCTGRRPPFGSAGTRTPTRRCRPTSPQREPRGPWVLPGRYAVRLAVGGETRTQPLVVRMDPRAQLVPGALAQQFALALRIVAALRGDSAALQRVRAVRMEVKRARERVGQGAAAALDSLDGRAAALESGVGEPPPPPGQRGKENLIRLNGDLVAVYGVVEGADATPTAAARAALGDLERALAELLTRLRELERRFYNRGP